jgi:hypothetical protein
MASTFTDLGLELWLLAKTLVHGAIKLILI